MKYISDSQTAMVKFTLAIDRPKKNGESQGADFINCVSFGKAAEAIEKWVHKGDRFGVQGRIKTGSYEKDGIKRYTTDVVVSSMDFLEKQRKDDERAAQSPTEGTQQDIMDGYQQIEEDMPF